MQLLECQEIVKIYSGKTILDKVSLSVRQHEIVSIVGPSGSGKTTFLRCVAGLDEINGGNILLKGQNLSAQRAEQRPIVMMFQQPLLFPHMTVYDNIVYGLKVRGEKRETLRQYGTEMLVRINMDEYAESYPYELSGGQQQRVALARALVMKPQVLLLDEPFASLDPELRVSIRGWVQQIIKNEGVTTLFVTHDKEEAMIVGDRVAVLHHGRIQQVGSSIEVYRNPVSRTVAEFFSDGLILDEGVFIPLDKIKIVPLDNNAPSHALYGFGAAVTGKWLKAGMLMYRIEARVPETELVVASVDEYEIGDQVFISFDEQDIHYLEGSHA